MAQVRHENGVDFSEVRARTESIDAGVRLTLVILCAAGWLYVAATWDRPDRQLIASLFGIGAVVALLFVLIPHERVVRSRWREPFFLLWSITQIALTAVVAWRRRWRRPVPSRCCSSSPSSSPRSRTRSTSVVAIAALDYSPTSRSESLGARPDPEYVGFFALCLGVHGGAVRLACPQPGPPPGGAARVSRADPLTGCLNRRGFEERFDGELSRALCARPAVRADQLDLDHFKEVNDTRGHAAGDELLRWAVDVMQETARPMDTVGRVGGDEFAVIVPGAGPDDSAAIARRSCRRARGTGPGIRWGGGVSRPTAPIATSCSARQTRSSTPASADATTPMKMTAKELSWATALARAVDDRMAVQHEHSWKVASTASASPSGSAGPSANWSCSQMAAILHDVGKVSIPDHVLRKPQPLTDRDWEAIRQNPVRGAEMVSRIQGLETIVPWIRHSLERLRRSAATRTA